MNKISAPAFTIDKVKCLANIQRMAEKASAHGLRFRPHFKTHQSAAIGEWFRGYGVDAITVSSVTMARYFADNGWNDITIAFLVNILEINDINQLASRITINLLVENEVALAFLEKNLSAETGIYIEIDTGYHRTGIEVTRTGRIDLMLALLKKSRLMRFRGFLSHSGQTYSARSVEEIVNLHADVVMKMRSLKHHYRPEWPGLEVSLGDTPACSVCEKWDEVDEIRPGNFVFYDLMQFRIGSCRYDDIAVRVVCPVVSRAVMRGEVIVYGGAVHLSKEFMIGPNGKKSYGIAVLPGMTMNPEDSNSAAWVAGLSQEHGIIRGSFESLNKLQPGDLIEIIPVHSCLAADLAGCYLTMDGEILSKMDKREIYGKEL